MGDSPIIDVAVGVAVLFAALATVSTAATEAVSRFLGLRGVFLLRGLRSLVDGSVEARPVLVQRLFTTPVMKNLGFERQFTVDLESGVDRIWTLRNLRKRWALPSYLPARSVASRVIDLAVPNFQARTTMTAILQGINNDNLLLPGILRDQLNSLAKTAGDDVDAFRTAVERWYDDHMDAVSGWYKRYTRWITTAIGVALVVGLNVQIFAFAQSLYTDQAVSQAMATKAVVASKCKAKGTEACVAEARRQLAALQPDLRLGWGRVPACKQHPGQCSFWNRHGFTNPHGGSAADVKMLLTLLVGWILTVVALIPGARFWYDLVNRFGSLRTSGPKPARTSAA